ncbi:MAG: HNH endonuclease [Armatimonadetes bacterium]|nr:HNH endonuclease [Armatimonadota bacterium]
MRYWLQPRHSYDRVRRRYLYFTEKQRKSGRAEEIGRGDHVLIYWAKLPRGTQTIVASVEVHGNLQRVPRGELRGGDDRWRYRRRTRLLSAIDPAHGCYGVPREEMLEVLAWPETRRRFSLMPILEPQFRELAARLKDRLSVLGLARDVRDSEPEVTREKLRALARGRRRSVLAIAEHVIKLYSAPSSAEVPSVRRSVSVPKTNRLLAEALKHLYASRCQICGDTFRTREGGRYSEVHHIRALSDGGPDAPWNMLVVCATCHTKLHLATVEGASCALETRRLTINGRTRRLKVHPNHLWLG